MYYQEEKTDMDINKGYIHEFLSTCTSSSNLLAK